MVQIIPAIAAELARGTEDALEQAGAVLTGNQAEYIKSGTPESIYGKLQQGAARQACRRYADDPSKFSGAAKTLVENACRPYLDDIGYGTGPTISEPFEGGQCPGVNYRAIGQVRYNIINTNTGETIPVSTDVATEFRLVGPVTGSSFRFFPAGGGPQSGFVITFDTAAGEATAFQTTNPSFPLSNPRFVGTLEPASGSPTDCGSPPPDIRDPIPPTSPGPVYEPYSPSPDIDVTIGVEVNIDGSINVDFGTGPITIDPFGGGGDAGGGGGDPGDPTDPGSPGAGGDTGAGGDAEGEAPPGEELVGLQVQVIGTPENPNRFDNNSAIVYRGIGYVRMGFPGRLGVDISGGTVISPQFFHAQQRGLTNWEVRANLGYNLRVTPYYRSLEE